MTALVIDSAWFAPEAVSDETRAFNEAMAAGPGPRLAEVGVEHMRGAGRPPKPPFSARAETRTIKGPGGAPVPIRVIAPDHPRGAYLHLHGGGLIFASEFTLQTLTPRPIQPEPVQFINTPLNLQICRKHKDNPAGIDLGPWFPSMDQAVATAATFSNAFPISPADRANAIGQRYHGPVVLITDARCYSATDIFAAGFQDHGIGPVLGVDDDTGAGGANVWTQDLLEKLLENGLLEAPA